MFKSVKRVNLGLNYFKKNLSNCIIQHDSILASLDAEEIRFTVYIFSSFTWFIKSILKLNCSLRFLLKHYIGERFHVTTFWKFIMKEKYSSNNLIVCYCHMNMFWGIKNLVLLFLWQCRYYMYARLSVCMYVYAGENDSI